MRLRRIILIVLVGLVASCIDPLDINIDEEVNILIVEGSITTQPGPHKIRLTRSARYGSIFDGFVRGVSRAKVVIRDSDGKNFSLSEDEVIQGIYYTEPGFQAEVGKSYTLLINTPEGNEYTSLPEPVIEATPVGELTADFKSVPLDNVVNETGLAVYASFQDDPDIRNYHMWKYSGTFRIETYPENFKARDPLGGPATIPAPKDCCRTCWVDEDGTSSTLNLFSDNNVNGNLVTDEVAFIVDDGFRYTEKYLIQVEKHTLTPEAYSFFKLLNEQASISGDIFDPPPATLRGNMINLTTPDENVIGYFRVSDVSIDTLSLTRKMLTEPKPLVNFEDDCLQFSNTATTARPSYW
jgi:hypothetical protein